MLDRRPPKPAKQIEYQPRPREFVLRRDDGKDRAHVSVPKLNYARDEAYRRLVAALACANCGSAPPNQAAHPNHGKGLALKTSDHDCFPMCPPCHTAWDTYQFGREVQRGLEPIYARRTRELLNPAAPQGLPLDAQAK